MTQSSITNFSTQAKRAIRKLSGASAASETAQHTAHHLENVERWAQAEIARIGKAHEGRIAELERRVARLEKVQQALLASAHPESAPDPLQALEVLDLPHGYYQRMTNILAAVEDASGIFSRSPQRVLEFFAGAAKSSEFLAGKVESYLGVEPSEVLRAAGQKKLAASDDGFALISLSELQAKEGSDAPYDIGLFLFEIQRWSIHDVELVLRASLSHLSAEAYLVFHVPTEFSALADAGWDIEELLASCVGVVSPVTQARTTALGEFIVYQRGDHER